MPYVADDDVLATMSRLGLDARLGYAFRCVHWYLTHNLPECCIALQVGMVNRFPRLTTERMRALIDDDGLLGQLAIANAYHANYWVWACKEAKKVGFECLSYVPCPTCVATKNFFTIPDGCPCCNDQEGYPDLGNDEETST
jgi:hypothetical protein